MKKENNKGAAMVTVLIAIVFIGILASSLLFMAYMNYMSKAMRVQSTDNFYTVEYGLADLSTTLQNIAAQYSDLNSAKEAVRNAVGGADGKYDPDLMQALIADAGVESNFIIDTLVKDASGNILTNYIEGPNYILFKGVVLKSRTPVGEYESTISSDIKLMFEKQTGTMDVNDFSIITDSPLSIQNNDILWSGNVFLSNGGNESANALTIGDSAIASVIGERGMINGNILVKKGGVLNIVGTDLIVYGDITVEDGGVIVCTGNITYTGSLNCGTNSKLGEQNFVHNPSLARYDFREQPEDGSTLPGYDRVLAKYLMAEVALYNGSEWKEGIKTSDIIDENKYMNNDNNMHDPTHNVNVKLVTSNVINGDFDNYLMVGKGDIKVADATFGSCTLVTTGTIIFETNNKGMWMSHLSDKQYEAAKDICVACNDTFNVGPVNNVRFPRISDNVLYSTFDFSGAISYNLTEPDPVNGTPGRVIYYKGGINYIPVGYLINESATQILSEAFSVGANEVDPKNNYIIYENWQKE